MDQPADLTPPDPDRRVLAAWEAFYALALLVAGTMVLTGPGPAWARFGAVGVFIVAAGWYWFAGRRQLLAPPIDRRQAAGYLAGTSSLYLAAVALHPASAWVMGALIPQAFWFLPLAYAVPVVIVICFVPAMLYVDLAAAPIGLVVAALSVFVGYTIDKVSKLNDRQAELIERLAASRAEVARLSHEAGVAAERQRLSHEIHDTLAQGFASVVALAQAAESALGADEAAARRHIELLARTGRENLEEARGMVAALAPAALDAGSLADAVRRQAKRLADQTELTVTSDVVELPALPKPVEVVLLRATQEALTNVRKHAAASDVTVRLHAGSGAVRLVVSDNGVGIADHGDGFGLRGMRARAEQVGGSLTVRSHPGEGTTVELEVPV